MSSSDSSSSSSSAHSSAPSRPPCRYRTARFHDQECSRYFDCPSHILARAREEEHNVQQQEEEEQLDEESGDDEDVDDDDDDDDVDGDDADVSQQDVTMRDVSDDEQDPLDQDLDQDGRTLADQHPEHTTNRQRVNAGKQRQEVIDLTDSPPQRTQDAPIIAGPSSTAQAGSRHAMDVIDLTGDSSPPQVPVLDRALPALPALDAPTSSLVAPPSRSGAVSPSAQRRPATPPSPPPPTRRRTSTNQFSGAPTSTSRQPQQHVQQVQQQQRRPSTTRRPSDITLPRWQPDAEVTFCPICRTQFSFLVRKHHCR